MTGNTSDECLDQPREDLGIDRQLAVAREIDHKDLACASSRYPVGVLREIASQVSRVADCLERRSENALSVFERRADR